MGNSSSQPSVDIKPTATQITVTEGGKTTTIGRSPNMRSEYTSSTGMKVMVFYDRIEIPSTKQKFVFTEPNKGWQKF